MTYDMDMRLLQWPYSQVSSFLLIIQPDSVLACATAEIFWSLTNILDKRWVALN